MNFLARTLLVFCGFMTSQIHATKYTCTQTVLGDLIFTSGFNTREECQKYWLGAGVICEKAGNGTVVDVNSEDI